MAKKKRKKKKLSAIERARIRARKHDRKVKENAKKSIIERAGLKSSQIYENRTNKLSEVIVDFSEPLLDAAGTTEKKRKALEIGVLAWNASFMDDDKFEKICRDEVRDAEAVKIFKYLRERRRTLFSEENRVVWQYEITETSKELHLYVASIVPSEQNDVESSP